MTVAELIKEIVFYITLGAIGGYIGSYLRELWQQRKF